MAQIDNMKMKKTLAMILFLLITQIGDTFAQKVFSGKVYYTIKLKTPELSEINNQESKRKLSKLINDASDVEAILLFKGTEAVFKLVNKIDNDATKGANLTKILGGNNDIYYYNYLNNELIKYTESLGEPFIVEIKKPDWKITQKTKVIGGYVCHMAVDKNSKNKKSQDIAWFTNQLPVDFGPKGYVGLPGLILEIETSSFIISTNKIQLNQKIKIKKPNKGRRVSSDEYYKILKKSTPFLFSN